MKYPIFLLALTVIFAQCDKRTETHKPLSSVDVAFEVQIIDKNGTDLLNPVNRINPKYIDKDKIKVEDISATESDAFELPSNINHPAPEFFILMPPDSKHERYRIRFYFNPFYHTSTILISFKENSVPDKFQGEIQKPLINKFVCTSILHNNEEVWNQSQSDGTDRNIVLTL